MFDWAAVRPRKAAVARRMVLESIVAVDCSRW